MVIVLIIAIIIALLLLLLLLVVVVVVVAAAVYAFIVSLIASELVDVARWGPGDLARGQAGGLAGCYDHCV